MLDFRFAIGSMLNKQLREVFEMMNHPNPFKVRITHHLEERYEQRVLDDANRKKFADLLKRITTIGLCELLYYQARHKLGEEITKIEFFNDDVIVPFNFLDDMVVFNTVFVRRPDQDRSEYRRIDVSSARLAQR